MASLLMPKVLVASELYLALGGRFESIEEAFRAGEGESLAQDLADTFDVNLPMVVYRIRELGFFGKPKGSGQ